MMSAIAVIGRPIIGRSRLASQFRAELLVDRARVGFCRVLTPVDLLRQPFPQPCEGPVAAARVSSGGFQAIRWNTCQVRSLASGRR